MYSKHHSGMAVDFVPRPRKETSRPIVVAALGIMQILSWGSTFYLLPVLGEPITRDTGWTYDWVMGGLALGLLVAGIISPRVGRRIGHRGGRVVLACGSASIAGGLVVVAIASSFGIYLVGWVLIGAGMGAALYDAAFATLGALYGKSARSAITSVTLFGGFASTVCWPLSAFLMAHVGWRGACFIYAAMHVALGFTLALIVLPDRRPEPSEATHQSAPVSVHLKGDERALFLLLAVVLTIGAAILSLVGSQLITLLLASGLELSKAVSLGMLIGPSAVGARSVEALVGARYHPIWTMVAAAILVGCGTLLFLFGPAAFGPAIAIYAAGNGIGSIAKGTLPLALFGPARYPALAGKIGLPVLFAMSLAPYVGALTFQLAGALATLSLALGLAATNVALVGILFGLTRDRRSQH
jgi:MFS family permease